jgi:hypothetical protein
MYQLVLTDSSADARDPPTSPLAKSIVLNGRLPDIRSRKGTRPWAGERIKFCCNQNLAL